MKQLITIGVTLLSLSAQAQLVVQNGATFFIDAGATVTVQGDVTASANITGTGKLLMKGTALQNLNLNGFSVPNLEIDNASHVALGGAGRVEGVLTFTNGKLQLGANNLTVSSAGSFTGAAAGKFVETNGTGELRKELTAAGSVTLPLGVGSDYTPLQYQLTGGTYTSAFVAGRAINGGHPAKHPRSTDFLNNYWSLNRSGVAGATVTAVGTYVDPSDVTGTEADLRAMTYNGSTWALGSAQDNAANTVTAAVPTNTGDLYAMNRFVLVSPKAFLQGAFDVNTGLMRDRYRNSTGTYSPGTLPASNILPTSDPYRNASLSTAFVHVANSVPETLTSSAVLNDQANSQNNIVDWVFVELRSISSPTVAPVVQTRSALIQVDGDIVDIDGLSPVYFKNIDAGNYAISLRHRNHLGLSTNPAIPVALSLANTNNDLSTAAAGSLFGSASNNYSVTSGKNLLLAGNAFLNTSSNYLGLNTDRAQVLTLMGNAGGSPTPSRILSTGADYFTYGLGDLNMNRTVDYLGLTPDRSFLLSTVLGGVPSPSPAKTQVLPN
ncbi:MAG: hypothetical protein LCH58_04130 [Bacteroidetes bacterium]|uniref:hypothetical protein n=1 Tax=Phnomibacter sp. TaxID=2836217 RepID=UPI002FDE10D6|nr:hypothetical protein [Bacteroidota bacterium]